MNLSDMMATGLFFNLVPWVVLIPVIGLLLNMLVGASLAAGLAFVVALLLAFSLSRQPGVTVVPFADWINIGTLQLNWVFRVDTLSVTMMLVVSGVGTLIHIYAIGYMHDDVRHNQDVPRFRRFFVFMNLFIAAMMILVSADNYLMMFVGWEGVGLCSYLLIGFWYEKGKDGIGNAQAGKKAFITNRIGDFGLLIALFIMFGAFGSLDFDRVFAQASTAAPGLILAVTLFMLLAVAGKSAQFPLFVWLPDAMAGPTPVSALIHAATMVTAGVYLIARSAPLFVLNPAAQSTVALVGGGTALLAATIALGQYDIKKVLAYSTISQLGFMVAAVGMGAFVAGMFHLVTHAFFKALLFLAAGSVIRGMERGEHKGGRASHPEVGGRASHPESTGRTAEAARSREGKLAFDPQDMRCMGGLRSKMPLTYWVYLIGALALAGVAPLAGFFSKDEILAEAIQLDPTVFYLLVTATFFTAFYMGRQVLLVFFGQPRSSAAGRASESPAVMTVPLVVLAVLSVFGGALNLPEFLGGQSLAQRLTAWLQQTLAHAVPGEFNPSVALVSLGLALLGLLIAWWFYGKSQPLGRAMVDPLRHLLGPIFIVFERRWWLDELFGLIVVRPYHTLAQFLARPVDLGVIDAAGSGLVRAVTWVSSGLRRLQTGFVRSYALVFMLGVIILMAYLLARSF
jgi:NADH-quinone oxidoreductase subunit L